MTHDDFLTWLNEEIQFAKDLKDNFPIQTPGYRSASDGIAIFTKVKEKFLTLTPPPTTLS